MFKPSAGQLLHADCGAEVRTLVECPDDAVTGLRCTCGSEFAPLTHPARRPRLAAALKSVTAPLLVTRHARHAP